MPAASHPRRWPILFVLSSALLLISMDATVLNVALPELAEDLGPSSTELLWIVDAYGLVLAGLLIAMGALGDRVGRRRLLLVGLAVFGVASAVVAVASSPLQLILARAFLGVGGAMVMPSTLSVLRNVFEDERERAIAIGVWTAVGSSGFALGPIIGGAILEVVSWHWVFAINLPVVVIAGALAFRWVPESRNPAPGPWDSVAVALSVTGMLTLVWGIKHGAKDGLGDPAALGAMAAGALALAAFVRRQAASATPILDVRLFRDRRFATAAGAVLFVFFGLGALLLLLTQYLQLVQDLSPLAAGIRLLPTALAAGVAAPLTDALVRRLGAHLVVGGAFALIAGGLAVLATLDADTAYPLVGLALTAVGAGAGLGATAGSAAIMAAAPAERAGGAAAVQETAFELGGALGVALLGSLMAAVYRSDLDVPGAAGDAAREGLPSAVQAAGQLGGDAGAALLTAAQSAFVDGLGITLGSAAAVMALVAALAVAVLPRRARTA